MNFSVKKANNLKGIRHAQYTRPLKFQSWLKFQKLLSIPSPIMTEALKIKQSGLAHHQSGSMTVYQDSMWPVSLISCTTPHFCFFFCWPPLFTLLSVHLKPYMFWFHRFLRGHKTKVLTQMSYGQFCLSTRYNFLQLLGLSFGKRHWIPIMP